MANSTSARGKKGKKNPNLVQFPSQSVWIKEMLNNVTFHPNTLRPDDVEFFQGGSHGRKYLLPKFNREGVVKNIRIAFKDAMPFVQPLTRAVVRAPKKKGVEESKGNTEEQQDFCHAEAAACANEPEETYVNTVEFNLAKMLAEGDAGQEWDAKFIMNMIRVLEGRVYDECLSENARMRVLNPKEQPLPQTLTLSVDSAKIWGAYEAIENGDAQPGDICIEFKSVTVRDRQGDKVLDEPYLSANARLVYPHRDVPLGGGKKDHVSLFLDDVPALPKVASKRKSEAKETASSSSATEESAESGDSVQSAGKRVRHDLECEEVLAQDPDAEDWEQLAKDAEAAQEATRTPKPPTARAAVHSRTPMRMPY